MLFETAAGEYMSDKSKRLRGNTLEGYESAIRRFYIDTSGWTHGIDNNATIEAITGLI